MLVIEKYKTGFPPPEDIPFEDLSKGGGGGGSDSGSSPNINTVQIGKLKDGSFTVKGTITGRAMKKRAGIFNIFSSRGVCIFVLLSLI